MGPTPCFFQLGAAGDGTVVRVPLCRPRFPAAVSARLSLYPLPCLPGGLLCGSTDSPTPFLCGITMAAGVSLPALVIQVTPSTAIL